MDAWDNSLDPLLVKNIILLFLNPDTNPHHAQLILTCHDISQYSDEPVYVAHPMDMEDSEILY